MDEMTLLDKLQVGSIKSEAKSFQGTPGSTYTIGHSNEGLPSAPKMLRTCRPKNNQSPLTYCSYVYPKQVADI